MLVRDEILSTQASIAEARLVLQAHLSSRKARRALDSVGVAPDALIRILDLADEIAVEALDTLDYAERATNTARKGEGSSLLEGEEPSLLD
ncbi:hypothetical protein P24_09896 [Oceanibaculum indicum P24]|uniref:Uncharacterized protein n=1 Tax=Oceanibaculum indicum P24 TaxID=1207063 RepID=K2JYX1_9PROT|nr:hypothetical protein P24_09896 [Oceanibaculum indicum P24]